MPTLGYCQNQLIDFFKSSDLPHFAEILRLGEAYNKDPKNKPNVKKCWEDLKKIALGSQHALNNFDPELLNGFRNYLAANASIDSYGVKIEKKYFDLAIDTVKLAKENASVLVTPSKNQALAIQLLFNERFLQFASVLAGEHPLPESIPTKLSHQRYTQFILDLQANAKGEKETDWLHKLYDILFELHCWIDSNPNLPGYSRCKDELHLHLLILQTEADEYCSQVSFSSRLGAMLLGPFFAIATILLQNPLRNILYGLARRNKLRIMEALIYPLSVLTGILLSPIIGLKVGLKGYSQIIKKQAYLHWDRYFWLSLLIIGAAIASALGVVFFPPIAPPFVGLPSMGFLASLSIPLLATVTGVTVAVLLTAMTSVITLVSTTPEVAYFNIGETKEPAAKASKDTDSLLDGLVSPHAQAALGIKSAKMFNVLPGEVEVKYHLKAASAESKQGNARLQKAKPCNLPMICMQFTDKQLSIIPLAAGLTGEIRLGIYPEPIVIENGQCKTKLPPYIKFNAYQTSPQPQNPFQSAAKPSVG